MGRRSDHTREQIVEMAINEGSALLSENGMSGFSARKVAARIGYTVTTIHHVFGGFEEFMLAINSSTMKKLLDYLNENAEESEIVRDEIHSLASCYHRFATENKPLFLALFEFSLAPGKESPDWYLKKIRHLFERVEGPLSRIIERDPAFLRSTSISLWSAVHGITILDVTGKISIVGDNENIDTLFTIVIDNAVEGMRQKIR